MKKIVYSMLDLIRIDNIAKTDMYKLAQSCFRLYSIF